MRLGTGYRFFWLLSARDRQLLMDALKAFVNSNEREADDLTMRAARLYDRLTREDT